MESKKIKNPKILKGVGMLRVSTDKQDIEGGSIEQQKNLILNRLYRQGKEDGNTYEIIEWHEEIISGKKENTNKRGALFQVMKKAETGLIDFVAVRKLDRFSRHSLFNLEFLDLLEKHNVKFIEADYGLYNPNRHSDWERIGRDNVEAEAYIRKLSYKITTSQSSARIFQKKDTSTAPILGLDPDPLRTGYYVVNESEKRQVEDIYRYFIQTKSVKDTVEYCKEKGYVTKVTESKERNEKGFRIKSRVRGGVPFDGNSLMRLLKSNKLRGVGSFKDIHGEFPDYQDENGIVFWEYEHGKVLSDELIDEVDKILLSRIHLTNNDKKRVYLLKDILFDSSGFKLSGQCPQGKTKNTYPSYTSKRTNPEGITVACSRVEKIVIARLQEYIKNSQTIQDVFIQSQKDSSVGLSMIEDQIKTCQLKVKELEQQVVKFQNLVTAFNSDTSNEDSVRKQHRLSA